MPTVRARALRPNRWSKHRLDAEMAALIDTLLRVVKVAVISVSRWPQFETQLRKIHTAPASGVIDDRGRSLADSQTVFRSPQESLNTFVIVQTSALQS